MKNNRSDLRFPDGNLTLIRFMSPWQGRAGFKKLCIDASSGNVVKKTHMGSQQVIEKTVKKIDGVVIRPTWPTQQRLCLLAQGDDFVFYEMRGKHILFEQGGLSLLDETFKISSKDYFLFKTYTFSTADKQYSFYDFASRLISPHATIIDPNLNLHFSSFRGLIETLEHKKQKPLFLSDLKKGKFKYRRLLKSMRKRINPARAT